MYKDEVTAIASAMQDSIGAFRRGVMLCAVAFSIVAMGIGLMRFRYSALVLVLLGAGATAGLAMWWRNRPAVLLRCGAIVCRDGALAQRDLWVYQATASGSDSKCPGRMSCGRILSRSWIDWR